MRKLNKAFSGTGVAAAMLAAVALSGCDPYPGANTSPPKVLGVLVADTFDNEVQPAQCSGAIDLANRALGCGADFDCPSAECQLANGTGSHTACTSNVNCTVVGETCKPGQCQLADFTGSHTACATNADCTVAGETCTSETCVTPTAAIAGSGATCGLMPIGQLIPNAGCYYTLPARAGAIWGAGYPAVDSSTGTWTATISNVPVGAASSGWPGPNGNYVWTFAGTRVIFNKLMDGASIQTSVTSLTPPPGSDLKIVQTVGVTTTTICDPYNTVTPVPCQFDVYYDPSSPTPNYGAAMVLVPNVSYPAGAGLLAPNASYHITVSTVKDQQGRAIPIDVTVNTIQ